MRSSMASGVTRIYVLDGLAIESTLPIEGARITQRRPDWSLTWTSNEEPTREGTTRWRGDVSEDGVVWGRFGMRGHETHVHLAGVGHLLASSETREARIYASPEAGHGPIGVLRRLLPYLGSLGGRTVLHAACAQFPAGAVLFAGASEAGKSTLALALDAAGVPVLSDDHVALDPAGPDGGGGWVAHASFPFVDVGPASRARFAARPSPAAGKASVRLRTPQPAGPVAVAGLAFVERGEALTVEDLPPAEAVVRLMKETLFAADLLDGDGHGKRLDGAIALAASVPTLRLTLPEGLDALAGSLEQLQALFPASDA